MSDPGSISAAPDAVEPYELTGNDILAARAVLTAALTDRYRQARQDMRALSMDALAEVHVHFATVTALIEGELEARFAQALRRAPSHVVVPEPPPSVPAEPQWRVLPLVERPPLTPARLYWPFGEEQRPS